MFWFNKKIGQSILKQQHHFKHIYSFQERQKKRATMEEKYVGNKAKGVSYLVLQKADSSKNVPFRKPYKLFAIDNQMQIHDVITYIRNNLKMTEKQSVFLVIGKAIANPSRTVGELYQIYSEPDGFLYVTVSQTEVF